jgi:hypothetical protein
MWAGAISVAIIVALMSFTIARLVRGDRRRHWRRGDALDPPWTGACSAVATVDLNVEPEHGEQLGFEVLRHCKVPPEGTRPGVPWVVGYGRMRWSTWGQEYAVGTESLGEAASRIWCCARPRFSFTRLDWGASRGAVAKMQRALDDVVGQPPANRT